MKSEKLPEYQCVRCSTILGPAVLNTCRAEGLYVAVIFISTFRYRCETCYAREAFSDIFLQMTGRRVTLRALAQDHYFRNLSPTFQQRTSW